MPAQMMVVEDEVLIALELDSILRSHGYGVLGCAESSLQALGMIDAACDADNIPDVAIIDLKLRDGTNGFTVAEYLRARCPDTSVIFASAYSDEITEGRVQQSQAFAYLLKPFMEQELIVTIRRALHAQRKMRREADVAAKANSYRQSRAATATV